MKLILIALAFIMAGCASKEQYVLTYERDNPEYSCTSEQAETLYSEYKKCLPYSDRDIAKAFLFEYETEWPTQKEFIKNKEETEKCLNKVSQIKYCKETNKFYTRMGRKKYATNLCSEATGEAKKACDGYKGER